MVKMADESSDDVSTLDISKLKVPDLKKELKNRGLSTSGNKNELIERLQSAIKLNEGGAADSIDDIEEDLLNDDDDEHIDERESLINDLDVLDDLPKAQKRKAESDNKSDLTNGPPKKVILKRNTSETLAAIGKANEEKSKEKDTDEKSFEKEDKNVDEKKVIKLSELSVKERLEMRAKKFGVTALSDDAKKLARAERFGSGVTSKSNSASSIKLNDTNASIDVLKQRAARFGVSVSSVMSEVEKQEKLKKRKERFGNTAPSNDKPVVDPESAKAARLERFKTTVT